MTARILFSSNFLLRMNTQMVYEFIVNLQTYYERDRGSCQRLFTLSDKTGVLAV